MATLEELQQGLIRADAAGNAEDAKAFADAIRSMHQAAPISTGERVLKGVRDPIDGGAQLLTRVLPGGVVKAGNDFNNWLADKTGLVGRLPEGGVDQQVREAEAAYQDRRQASGQTGVDWARIGGNVISPANLAIAARAPAGATLMARMLAGAGAGAASSSLNPVTGEDYWGDKAKQMAVGTVFGGAMPALMQGVGRLISPAASRNPNVQLLRKEGVQPTIGQTLGGWANRLEEKATSLPVVGDSIAAARGRAQEQFNRAALNRALSPIGQSADEVGQGGVAAAQTAVRNAYDAADNAMGTFRLDRQGVADIRNVQAMARALADKERGQFETVWNTVATDITPRGSVLPGSFKKIDSKLGAEAAKFSGSPDAYQQQLGEAIGELRTAFRSTAMRTNPQAAELTRQADKAYANLVRVEGASKAAANNSGVFTPAQLNMAVRQADQSVRDRATASGSALMQDLSNAGQSVLGNRVPNSGTTDRMLLIGTGAGAMANPMLTGAGLLGGAALYTQPMQTLLRGAVSARNPQAEAIARALLKASPSLAPAAAQVGPALLE